MPRMPNLPRPGPGDSFGESTFVTEFSKRLHNNAGTWRVAILRCSCGQFFSRELRKLNAGKATTNCGCSVYRDYFNLEELHRMVGGVE